MAIPHLFALYVPTLLYTQKQAKLLTPTGIYNLEKGEHLGHI